MLNAINKKKILIADDDPAILDSLRLILEVDGYEVTTVDRGEEIVKVVESKPDLLLLDIWMAGQDGRELCRKLKSDKRTASIPIILFSAGREMADSAKAAGANDFVEKPFEIETLLEKIQKLTS
jgi:CheY-like chemotaxis protein